MRKVLLVLLSMILGVSLDAQVLERIYTKNGDIYEGFISEQVPGESISIYAEKVTLSLPTAELSNIRKDYRSFNSLTGSARKWFNNNGDTLSVMLTTFEHKSGIYDNVLVLNQKDSHTKFISFDNRTYKLPWDDVYKTTKDVVEDVPYGIQDILLLKTGERLVGTITEQIIGESIKLKTVEGVYRNILVEDILSARYEKIDSESGLWKQAKFLDRIYVEGEGLVEGFIVSRIMGQKLNILKKGSDDEISFELDRIAKYQKFWNCDFVEYQPPVVDTTKRVLFNGKEVALSETFSDEKFTYAVDSLYVEASVGEVLKVEVFNATCGKTAQLYRTEKVKVCDKDDIDHYGKSFIAIRFGADPIFESAFIMPEESCNVCEVIIRKAGTYFLSIGNLDSVIIIHTK